MKRKHFKRAAITFLMIGGLLTATLFASNGYFGYGIGVHYQGMAGAGIGLHLSALGAATNPASMVFLGKRYDIGISVFNPNRKYTVSGNPSFVAGTFGLSPGTVESGSKAFAIPSFGANWMLGEDKSFGLAIYGNGGMNTDYDHPVFGFQTTGINLIQLFVAPTFAKKFGENHSLGISPILAYQRFEANGLLAFSDFSSDASKLSNNGTDNSAGFGLRVGYLGKLTDFLSIGASFQTKTYLFSSFDDYAGLFAGKGEFDIPMNWTVGAALEFDKLKVALDVQQIYYSKIKSIANPLLPNLQQDQLGNENGAGFGWEDMTVFKLGLSYAINEGMTVRAGYSYGSQPIPESETLFNILAPGVVEQHLTLGLSKTINEDKEISFFLMHALSNSVKGSNPLEFPGQQTIELTMDQWEFGVGFSF